MVLDVSKSLDKIGRGTFVNFIRNVINALDIGPNNTLVGMIFFTRNASYNFTLNQFTTKTQLLQAIDDIGMSYPIWSGTKFKPIYELIRNTVSNVSLGFRPDFKNVGIILTDGKSKEKKTKLSNVANSFHEDGILDDLTLWGFQITLILLNYNSLLVTTVLHFVVLWFLDQLLTIFSKASFSDCVKNQVSVTILWFH